MKKFRSIFCLLFVAVMLLSVVCSGVPAKAAQALIVTEDDVNPDRLLYTFTADNFSLPYADLENGDCFMEDADSSVGKAAVLSYEKRAAFGDKGMINAMIRTGTQFLSIYSQGDPYVAVGEISIQQLRDNAANGGYTMYKFTNVDLMPGEGDYFIYIFDCWGFQVRFTDEQKENLRGKTIDFYLSLKVTGDVANDTDNTPTYYIDKIILAESDPNAVHVHNFTGWTVTSDVHIRSCLECGEIVQGAHQWDEGTVTKEATETENGEKVYHCVECDKTKTITLNSIGNNAPSKTSADNSTTVIILIVLGVLAAGVVVAAVLLLKKKK